MIEPNDKQRLDKWLWHARFFKSRTLAASAVVARKIRVNRQIVDKSHASIRPGDVITFSSGIYVRIVEIKLLSTRRGPAVEAQSLYNDLDPPTPYITVPPSSGMRNKGSGRPTKTERRALDRLKKM